MDVINKALIEAIKAFLKDPQKAVNEAVEDFSKRGQFGNCLFCGNPIKDFDFDLWRAVLSKEGYSNRLPEFPHICRKCWKSIKRNNTNK
jgi:hypothetical protein